MKFKLVLLALHRGFIILMKLGARYSMIRYSVVRNSKCCLL